MRVCVEMHGKIIKIQWILDIAKNRAEMEYTLNV